MACVIQEYNKIRYGENTTKEHKQKYKNKNRKKRLLYYGVALLLFTLSIHEEYRQVYTFLDSHWTSSVPMTAEIKEEEGEGGEALGEEWQTCLISGPSDRFCHLESRYWWRHPESDITNDERQYFIDENDELLFTTKLTYPNLLYPFEPHPNNSIALVRESHLVTEVTHIARMNALKCICGTFLGLTDNIVFLRRQSTEEWIVIYDAQFHRQSSTAWEIESESSFPEKWQPYSTKMKHYNQFIISFRTIDRENHYLFKKNNNKKEQVILQRLRLNRTKARIMIELEGIDASCYIHCRRLESDIGNQ